MRVVRFTLTDGKPYLVQTPFITSVTEHAPGGSKLRIMTFTRDYEVIVKETLDEVEKMIG